MSVPSPISVARGAHRRIRPHLAAVVQTAIAALGAWWLALVLLPAEQPAFASIAAIVSLGVAHGRRGRRAIELVGGVLLGITVGSVLVWLIGTGVLQIGLLVVLAMTVALLLRPSEMVVTEAAVSAILLAAFQPTGAGFSADRILEGAIGGAVALVVAALVLPPDPVRLVSEVAGGLFDRLAATLQDIADGLASGDPESTHAALKSARALDDAVEALEERLLVGTETATLAPARRRDVVLLRRYERALPQLDFAVRNTRVLARHASHHARRRGDTPPALIGAVEQLVEAVRALAVQYASREPSDCPRHFALNAAWAATSIRDREPALAEIVSQIRLIAVDLVRAADLIAQDHLLSVVEDPTEELLAARPADDGVRVPA